MTKQELRKRFLRRAGLTAKQAEKELGPGFRLLSIKELRWILKEWARRTKADVLRDLLSDIIRSVERGRTLTLTHPEVKAASDFLDFLKENGDDT